MSKYMEVQTELKDVATFVAALTAVCQNNRLLVEKGPGLVAYGYSNQTIDADFVIRKRQLGAYGDLAFCKTSDGIKVVVDDLDDRGQEIVRQIKQQYARTRIEKVARARGLVVEEVPAEGGAIRLRLVAPDSARQDRVHVRRGR